MEFNEAKVLPSSEHEHLYQQMLEQSDACDVTVQIGDWKKKCHWRVLVMSPFFENLHRHNFIEKQTGVINLHETSPLAVEAVIHFMYGKRPNLTEENAAEILELSEFLLMESLTRICESFFRSTTLTDENCMEILVLSSLYNFEHTPCYDYVRGHLHEILKKREARRLTKESVINLLTDPLLTHVSGEDKFNFIVEWAKEFERNGTAFSEVFDAIGLDDMDAVFIENVVRDHPLVVSNYCKVPDARHLLGQHRVLISEELREGNRIACFDLEREKWFGLTIKMPNFAVSDEVIGINLKGIESGNHSKIYTELRQPSPRFTGTTRAYMKGHHTIYKHDLQSMKVTEYHIKVSDADKDIRTFCIAEDIYVGVLRNRQQHKFRHGVRLDTRHTYVETIYYGKLQYPETKVEPILSMFTILFETIDAICLSGRNLIGCVTTDGYMYIYDMSTCTLDRIVIPITRILGRRYSLNLFAAEDGFVLSSGRYEKFSIFRLQGPDLTEKYSVRYNPFPYSILQKKSEYIFCNNTWFHVLKRTYGDTVEFASVSHDTLNRLQRNGEDIPWKQHPSIGKLRHIVRTSYMFMIRLPKSILKCQFDCPHCEQCDPKIRDTWKLTRHLRSDSGDDVSDHDDYAVEYD